MITECTEPNSGSRGEAGDLPARTSASSVSSCSPFVLALRRVEDTMTSSTTALQRETRLHQRIQDTAETLRYVLDSEVPEEILSRQKKVDEEVQSAGRSQRREHPSRNKTLPHPLCVSSSAEVGAVLGHTEKKCSPPSPVVTAYFDALVREWCGQNAFSSRSGGGDKDDHRLVLEAEEEEGYDKKSEEECTMCSLLPHSRNTDDKSMACTTSKTISMSPLWLAMTFMRQSITEHTQHAMHGLDRCIQRVQNLTSQLQSIEQDYHRTFLIAACAAAVEQSSLEAFIERKANVRSPAALSSSIASSQALYRDEEEEQEEEDEEIKKKKKIAEEEHDATEKEAAVHSSVGSMDVTSVSSAKSDVLQEAYHTVVEHLLHLSPFTEGVSNLSFTGDTSVCHGKQELEEEGERVGWNQNPPQGSHSTDEVVSVWKEMQENHTLVFPSPEVFFVRKIARVVLDHLPPLQPSDVSH